jgi:hypothetical protein
MFSSKSVILFLLCLMLRASEPVPAPRPVGVKITRPGVVGIAGTPPVGGSLLVFGYSFEEPPAGQHLQGMSTFYEYTLEKRISLFFTTTEPLIRAGSVGIGDTSPGIKFRFAPESRCRPLLAVAYSLKVPTATEGFGTGFYDHKVTLLADKNVGVSRWTGNFGISWCRQKNGNFKQVYSPSLAYLTRFNSRWGGTLQTYWTTYGKGYGGIVAAPFFQVNSGFNIFAGGMRNVGQPGCQYGLIAGFNYMHRPRR